jgi:iron complex outermembrane receptor protein
MKSNQQYYISKATLLKTLLLFITIYLPASFTYAQSVINGSIKGTVKTADGKPAEGVTVAIKDLKKGTIVNRDGEFTLNHITKGTYTLSASFVGLKSQTQQVTILSNETVVVNIMLTANSKQLNEVVIRSHKANRFATVKSDDVAKMPLNDLENSQVYSTVSSNLMTDQSIHSLDAALKNVPGAYQLWAATDRSGFGNGSSFVFSA